LQLLNKLTSFYTVQLALCRAITTCTARRGKATIRYHTRCHFNVQSKPDMSRFDLPHGTKKLKTRKNRKLRSKKRICKTTYERFVSILLLSPVVWPAQHDRVVLETSESRTLNSTTQQSTSVTLTDHHLQLPVVHIYGCVRLRRLSTTDFHKYKL